MSGGDTADLPEPGLDADLTADRDRIAALLNGSVIHALFGVSLSLNGALALENTDQVHGRVREAIDELDHAITAVRSAVFEVRTP